MKTYKLFFFVLTLFIAWSCIDSNYVFDEISDTSQLNIDNRSLPDSNCSALDTLFSDSSFCDFYFQIVCDSVGPDTLLDSCCYYTVNICFNEDCKDDKELIVIIDQQIIPFIFCPSIGCPYVSLCASVYDCERDGIDISVFVENDYQQMDLVLDGIYECACCDDGH